MALIDEIRNVCTAEQISARDDGAITALVNAARPPKIIPTEIGIGTILAVMAPNGGLFLDGLETMAVAAAGTAAGANVKWTLKLIEASTFDVGHPVTRAQLKVFATDNPAMADGITALLAVAEQPDPVSIGAVSDALNGA